MFLTRLYRHVMEHYPHLDNGIYNVVDRFMRQLALKQTRKPQSDRGKARHSVSSTSSHHYYGSSSHQRDDDEDDGASRTRTLSLTTYLNSLRLLNYQRHDIPTSSQQDDDLLFERQTILLNQSKQIHEEVRDGFKSFGKAFLGYPYPENSNILWKTLNKFKFIPFPYYSLLINSLQMFTTTSSSSSSIINHHKPPWHPLELSFPKASKRPKINIIPPKQLFVDLTQNDTKTPLPKHQLPSPSALNVPSKTPSTKDTSSSSIDYIPKSPTSTSPSTNGYLNSSTSPPPRVPPPLSTQQIKPIEIIITPSPPSPLFGHPIS
uniref:Ribosomal protein L7Ae/L30e/S12e/Gadd45 n=1 Tax=Tanacetum cinerariifolium TaxID=118510 RepID=A0A6L2JNY0_TANCI|nr:ribosomal protein L7Ae/L30e/S12e/Gadd45 [Tanacetum cinerariifolium]